jgi:hypothetical protein
VVLRLHARRADAEALLCRTWSCGNTNASGPLLVFPHPRRGTHMTEMILFILAARSETPRPNDMAGHPLSL